MIKKLLLILAAFFISTSCAYALDYNQNITPEVANGIRKYKSGNYVGCLQDLYRYYKKDYVKNSKNQLAAYYMAMSYVQAGDVERAKNYYKLTKTLNPNNTLGRYAQKGIVCIDTPAKCYIHDKPAVKQAEKLTDLDKFIRAPYGNGLSSDLSKEIERKRVERLRREMNSDEELNKYEFKNFRDFSTKGRKTGFNFDGLKLASASDPTDAEIVNALRVLNAAGLTNIAKPAQNKMTETPSNNETTAVKSEYKPDVTREEYQQQIQKEMLQAQMAAMSQPNVDALFGEKNNNNQNNMMMNMLPFMMAQQAAAQQNSNNGGTPQQPMITPEMMQTMMFNSLMPNMNFGLGGSN